MYLRYGQSLMKYGKYEDALEQFEKYKELVPDDPQAQGMRSIITELEEES